MDLPTTDAAAHRDSPGVAAEAGHVQALLVDDNRMNQLVAAGLLTRLGFVVEIVASGAEAVAACAERRYDFVLMDIMMPGMDGYETTACIRADDAAHGRYTPIVGLSARDMASDQAAALAAGLDDYLTKPIRPEDLWQALRRWMPAAVAGVGDPA